MTFSILGLCARTGCFGVALATSSIAAGGRCPFIDPGLGVVVTQARTDPRLGPMTFALLESGLSAPAAVGRLSATAENGAWRQLAALDRQGRGAFHTGPAVGKPADGMVIENAVIVGNWIRSESVIAGMASGFDLNPGEDLGERLLQALESGLDEGGEIDPLQSAALIIADPDVPFPITDLRVDLSDRPVSDLRRIYERWRPLSAGYLQRALDPSGAPDTRDLEGRA